MALDRARLLEWLTVRSKARSLIVAAIYLGLIARIKRGEFDEEEKEGGKT